MQRGDLGRPAGSGGGATAPAAADPAMNPDSDDHAFVIQFYHDEGHRLRGHVTHAYSRRRLAVNRPEDVLVFLDPYLADLGVRLSPGSRLVLWLCRRFGGPPADA